MFRTEFLYETDSLFSPIDFKTTEATIVVEQARADREIYETYGQGEWVALIENEAGIKSLTHGAGTDNPEEVEAYLNAFGAERIKVIGFGVGRARYGMQEDWIQKALFPELR